MKIEFDWGELAFGSRKKVNDLKAIFIAAPREISAKRFTQLVKQYLPQGNIIIGIANEDFIPGFGDQPQFRTLKLETVQTIIDKVNAASTHKIYVLSYFLRDQKYLFDKLHFKKAVFINGSWYHSFHTTQTYYALMKNGILYEQVSPFTSEEEAKAYEAKVIKEIHEINDSFLKPGLRLSETAMMDTANRVAKFSFDHSHQTGVALAQKQNDGTYELLVTSFNRVVPYQTFAWHFGPQREKHFSPPNDLNHYDAVHAEVELVIKAGREHIDLAGTTLFINLLPCPTCSRMLMQTDIDEVVYAVDHSEGYAIAMLEAAGKKVCRMVAEG